MVSKHKHIKNIVLIKKALSPTIVDKKVQQYQMTVYVTGIDMSEAIDIRHRNKLLDVPEDVLGKNGARMLRVLITDTTTEIKIKDAITTLVQVTSEPHKHTSRQLYWTII